ncbi:hypothetical protein [Fictibacillus fluitans]|uniref:Uncharacterized protein n=1 Tax=Fictibacillus fluitans TaxID=3058422 RepID=A0ABT8HWZ7_9BACL|nr:hypothetical protein [Fictibacillus sp. NE201]MDN4525312.1 hypothetical protein [Fictibacillus sp. NE201]
MINPDFPIKDKYYRGTDGVLTILNGYGSTDLIPAVPGMQYKKNFSSSITYWDASGNFISGKDGEGLSFIVPKDNRIKFMRSSALLSFGQWVLMKGNNIVDGYIKRRNDFKVLPNTNYEVQDYNPNAEIPLFIETNNDGKNQPIHPKVIAFDTAWNGFRFWMAYTPYPNAQPGAENPCIAASNDMIKWVTPSGASNPLVPTPNNGLNSMKYYNSDTHLLYNANTGKLEMYYREVWDTYENIYRITSSNGSIWGAPELVKTTNGLNPPHVRILICPVVILKGTTYQLFVMEDGKIRLYESGDNFSTWTDKGTLKRDGGADLLTWHMDIMVNPLNGYYEMLNNHNDQTTTPKDGILTHYISTDGLNWTQSDFYMLPSYGSKRWDNQGLYRSTLVFADYRYYLIYTGISTFNEWRLGLSMSDDDNIMTMRGTDYTYKALMAFPSKKNPVGVPGDFLYDSTLNKMIYCVEKAGVKVWVDASGVNV